MPSGFILLSHERSGSHFVGEFLSSLANFRMFDEVCNPDAVKPAKAKESFYRFKYDAITKDPRLMLEPTVRSHHDFVQSYFDHLLALGAPHNIGVDIKYGHVQNFEWWWWPILERPTLLTLCESSQIDIVHLYRENVVEATVSAMIAQRRKIWHSWQAGADAANHGPYKLSVEEVIRRARLLERQTGWFKEWTKRNARIELTYERAAAELGKGGALDASLTGFLNTALKKPFEPRVQKLTPPMREIVENFADLKAACETAGWGRFVS
ncbi:MAG TPA: hypothetical protein VHE09_01515 [Rhizomicrobium sp.]|nr:hypothetical protein [Rhizomicrobium sp.]